MSKTNRQITQEIPGAWLLTIPEARLLLKAQFNLSFSDQVMRRFAREGIMPFFKIIPDSETSAYVIEADDVRAHIWNQRNKARANSAA